MTYFSLNHHNKPALLAEANSSLPFPLFGRSGGYGHIRAALKSAILDGATQTTLDNLFKQLYLDGLHDYHAECLEEGDTSDARFHDVSIAFQLGLSGSEAVRIILCK